MVELKTYYERDEVAEVTSWITPILVERDHRDVRQKLGERHFHSGNWYLVDPMVRRWRDWTEDNQCLWLRGGVGTGKSSLTSILIDSLIRSPDGNVAFFYCSNKVDKGGGYQGSCSERLGGENRKLTIDSGTDEKSTTRNNYENILRSLLAQAAVSIDGKTIYQGVRKRFNRDPRHVLAGLGLSGDECVELLQDIFAVDAAVHFTIVVDALDECSDYDFLLQRLRNATDSQPNVKLVFSSRFQVKVDEYFPSPSIVTIESQNAGDIERFIDIEIPKRRVGSGMTDDQASRFKKALLDRASGMLVVFFSASFVD